jgi:hypothetical protein
MSKKHEPQILYADATLNITMSLSIWSGTTSNGIHRRLMISSLSGVINNQQLSHRLCVLDDSLQPTFYLDG